MENIIGDMSALKNLWGAFLDATVMWLSDPATYTQAAAIAVILLISFMVRNSLIRKFEGLTGKLQENKSLKKIAELISRAKPVIPYLFALLLLAATKALSVSLFGKQAVVSLALSVTLIVTIWKLAHAYISHPIIRSLCLWLFIPLAALKVFGVLDPIIKFLDGIAITAGNIHISLFVLMKALIAAAILFWIGRWGNEAGQKYIRARKSLDIPTKELFAKLFEIAIYVCVFLLLLQIVGLDLTTLAVFGGALGVGLGFGLQKIASNFISGIILLLEKSVAVGDHIEMDDGKEGTLTKLGARSSIIQTYDGKEIMIPNEDFITSRVTNWTHSNPLNRYEVDFSVSYDTDIEKIPPLIIKALKAEDYILDKPEEPDVELRGFGESGIDFGVEFWVDGIDDGENKYSSEVLMLIWKTLKKANVEIPYPQRVVHLKQDLGVPQIKKTASRERAPKK